MLADYWARFVQLIQTAFHHMELVWASCRFSLKSLGMIPCPVREMRIDEKPAAILELDEIPLAVASVAGLGGQRQMALQFKLGMQHQRR